MARVRVRVRVRVTGRVRVRVMATRVLLLVARELRMMVNLSKGPHG